MRERLTPISRSELIDLEDLFHQFHEQHRHLLHPSLLQTPGGSVGSPSSSFPPSPAFATPTTITDAEKVPSIPPTYLHDNPSAHPLVHGRFCDVFEDVFTSYRWRLHERMLYVVWWSFRPAFCQDCGMQEAWLPSRDGEFKCAQCGTFAGSTKGNKIVQDAPPTNTVQIQKPGPPSAATRVVHSDDDDDDDGDDGDEKLGGDPDGDEADATANILSVYTFLYEWLTWIPSPGPVDRGKPLFQLPSGEALPTVLRAAYDLTLVLTMPTAVSGTEMSFTTMRVSDNNTAPFSSAPLIARGCSLYLSLLLHQFPIPFPLFVQGMRGSRELSSPNATGGGGGTSTLEWVDVECAAMLTGIPLENDFFASLPKDAEEESAGMTSGPGRTAAGLCLQNVAAVCDAARCPIPSVLWDLSRVPHHMAFLRDEVAPRRLPRHPTLPRLHAVHALATNTAEEAEKVEVEEVTRACFTGTRQHTHAVISLCPEHTAMAVIMTLAREVDRQSLWSLGVRIVAAADQKRRHNARGRKREREPHMNNHHDGVHGEDVENPDEAYVLANPKLVQKAWEVAEYHAERLAKWYQEDYLYGGGWNRDAKLPALYPSLTSFNGDKEAWHKALREPAACRFQAYVNVAEQKASTTSGQECKKGEGEEEQEGFVRDVYFTDSPSANALIFIFARAFLHPLHPFDIADLVRRSGLYAGGHRCSELLQAAAASGDFSLLPLVRRLSPLISLWVSPYLALHSNDRLPFIAALRLLHCLRNVSGKAYIVAIQQLQRILAKHGGVRYYQMNYVIRVTDPRERNFNGFYFLSAVYGKKGIAVFTCIRSGRKTIAFNAHNRMISLFYLNERERIVRDLQMHFITGETPVIAGLETPTTAVVLDVAKPFDDRRSQYKSHAWTIVARLMEQCGRLRRRMRMPMLASRLEALSSIRDLSALGAVDGGGAFGSNGAGGGADGNGTAGSESTPSGATTGGGPQPQGGGPVGGGPQSLGEMTSAEYDLTCADPFDLVQCRDVIQKEVLALESNPSFLFGLPDDKVVALYAMTVAFLEFITAKQMEWGTTASPAPPKAASHAKHSLSPLDRKTPPPSRTAQRGGGGGGGRTPATGRRAQLSPPVAPRRSPILSPLSPGGHHKGSDGPEETAPNRPAATLLNWVEELCHNEANEDSSSDDEAYDEDEDDNIKHDNEDDDLASGGGPPRRHDNNDDDEAGLGYATTTSRHTLPLLPPSTALTSVGGGRRAPALSPPHVPSSFTVSSAATGGVMPSSRRQARLTMTPVQAAKKSPIIERLPPPLALPPSTRTSADGPGAVCLDERNGPHPPHTALSSSPSSTLERRREARWKARRAIQKRYLGPLPSFKEVLVDGGLDALYELQKSMRREAGVEESESESESDSGESSSSLSSVSSAASSAFSHSNSSSRSASEAPNRLKDDAVVCEEAAQRLSAGTHRNSYEKGNGPAGRSTPITSSSARPDTSAPAPLPQQQGNDSTAAILLDSFTLFDADKCRRKLTRLIVFIRDYHRFKSELRSLMRVLVKNSRPAASLEGEAHDTDDNPHVGLSPNSLPSPFELPSTTMTLSDSSAAGAERQAPPRHVSPPTPVEKRQKKKRDSPGSNTGPASGETATATADLDFSPVEPLVLPSTTSSTTVAHQRQLRDDVRGQTRRRNHSRSSSSSSRSSDAEGEESAGESNISPLGNSQQQLLSVGHRRARNKDTGRRRRRRVEQENQQGRSSQ